MKKFITYLSLATLIIIGITLSFAQQNQSAQKPNSEIETLKIQLQTVENEKIELTAKLLDAQAKLADANAKLINAEFGKFERALRDSNNKWLWGWTTFFVGIFAVIGIALWFFVKSLIADRVEKSLNGFKEAVDRVNVLQDQIRILEREHAASVLEGSVHLPDTEGRLYSETVKALPDGGLLDLIVDKTRGLDFRYKAAEVLFVRKNPKLVSPVLELLNSVVDSEVNWDDSEDLEWRSRRLINFLGQLHTQETYEGLTKFLNRLLVEGSEYKDLFLTWTVFSLAYVSIELDGRSSVPIIRRTIPDLKVFSHEDQALENLAEYFDKFDESDGIKDILTNGLTDRMPEVETRCLELLQKHDPDFVEKWKAQKKSANTQNEEPS
ncbi:MAG: hypothetical protein OXU36_05550 [Candidatus Poribacteria bacterium]|nr:hypothetical protein [Candidatus Poribacteria bacterium]